jgi:Lipase (class 3)
MKPCLVLVLALFGSSLCSFPAASLSRNDPPLENARHVLNLSSRPPPRYAQLRATTLLAYAAYCPPAQLKTWSCFWCRELERKATKTRVHVHSVVSNASAYTQAFVATLEPTPERGTDGEPPNVLPFDAVVSFRGTVGSLANWIEDLKVMRTHAAVPNVPGALVADGFWDAWLSLRSQVERALFSAAADRAPSTPSGGKLRVLVTGHSLGASMAVLCAADLAQHGRFDLSVTTFGCPRTGNAAFAEHVDRVVNASWRTVWIDDVVPHYPPEFLGYHHTAHELWFSNNSTAFRDCDGSGEDEHCSDSVPVDQYSISDHLEYLGLDQREGPKHDCCATC